MRELAERHNVSINPFVPLAVAEKVAALRTLDYIEQHGQRGSRNRFDRVLQKVAEVNLKPYTADHLPEGTDLTLAQ